MDLGGRDGKPFPDDQHVALTHWSAGGEDDRARASRSGCGSTAPTVSGAALEDFMLEYPYTDSPEPGAA